MATGGTVHSPLPPSPVHPSGSSSGPPPSSPTSSPQPSSGSGAFGPGQYRVGRDIQAGRYFSDPDRGCYWERQSGLGGSLSDVIANEFIGFDAGQWIVDISSTDVAFEADADCGKWYSTKRRGLETNISPGMWRVGNQVRAGTYRATTSSGCYWERLRDYSGTLSGIIANDFVSSPGPQFVTIKTCDAGFNSDDDCGVWRPVAGVIAISPMEVNPQSAITGRD